VLSPSTPAPAPAVILADHFTLKSFSDFNSLPINPTFPWGKSGTTYNPTTGSTLKGTVVTTTTGALSNGYYAFPASVTSGYFILSYSIFSNDDSGDSFNSNIGNIQIVNGNLVDLFDSSGGINSKTYATNAGQATGGDTLSYMVNCTVEVTGAGCQVTWENGAPDWGATQAGDFWVTQIPSTIN